MDEVSLSRIEIEWLIACDHSSGMYMPLYVFERLISVGFITGAKDPTTTPRGRLWLQAHGHRLTGGMPPFPVF